MNLRLVIVFLINLLIVSSSIHPLKAQQPDLNFKHITTLDGLSEGFAKNTIVDHLGFVWIATINGLNKYDGYNFTVFKNNHLDSTSLVSSNTRYVYEDSENNLWVATNDGIDLFDREKNSFLHFPETNNEFIRCILEDHNKDLWVAGSGYLFKLDKKEKKFKKKFLKDFHSAVEYLYEDSKHNLWIGAADGVGYLDTSRENFFQKSIGKKAVYAIVEDDQKKIWLGTRNEGLIVLDPKNNSLRLFKQDLKQKNGLESDKILSLFKDKKGDIWIGTEHGSLSIYDSEKDKFSNYAFNEADDKSLLHNSIYNIYKDKNNQIWLSCFGGVEMLVQDRFKHIRANALLKSGLSFNNVLCFYQDSKGRFWIGTDGGGLNRWNRETNTFKHYKHDPRNPKAIASNAVLAIEEDESGKLWIATWGGGLNIFDPDKEVFEKMVENPSNPSALLSNNIYGLYKDQDNDLWVHTLLGLDLYNKKTKSFEHYNIPHTGLTDLVAGMYEDQEGNLWVGSFNGLYTLNKNTKKVTAFPHKDGDPTSISNDQITSIKEDSKGNLWVFTANGMNLYDEDKNTFSALTKKDGLPADFVNGFLEDKKGNFWISTANGISMFNPDSREFRNYDISDGLQGNSFSIHAIYQRENGEMFFGGANGFNIVEPEKIEENTVPPPVVITDFKIFNESIKINAPGSPLKSHISMAKEIILSYKQSVISFDFAALNYIATEKNNYSYIMEGFEEKWNYVNDKRSATYTNLDPGEYIFRVKASNNDGYWNEKGAALRIIIKPPYWGTWWFRFAVGLGGVIVMLLIFKNRVRNIEKYNVELEEKVSLRTAEISSQKEELLEQRKFIESLYTELKDSIKAAKAIQNSILPPPKLINSFLPESFILNKPKDVVGGDFYFFTAVEDKIVIAVIDCSGHGVSGAFMSIIGYNLLNKIIGSSLSYSAAEILEELNLGVINQLYHFQEDSETMDGMDVALCIISNEGKDIQYSGANTPLYMVRNNELIQVKGNKFSIGKGVEGQIKKFDNHNLKMEKGDVVYLFSDGYADQIGGPTGDEKLMYPRFRELLIDISQKDMKSQQSILETKLNKWRNNEPQLDDVLILGFRI